LLIVVLHFNPMHLTVRDTLLDVPMLNKLLGNVAIDPSYWTLTYEVLFYAGAAMIFLGSRSSGSSRLAWRGWG
jgi:hypothetical protein